MLFRLLINVIDLHIFIFWNSWSHRFLYASIPFTVTATNREIEFCSLLPFLKLTTASHCCVNLFEVFLWRSEEFYVSFRDNIELEIAIPMHAYHQTEDGSKNEINYNYEEKSAATRSDFFSLILTLSESYMYPDKSMRQASRNYLS